MTYADIPDLMLGFRELSEIEVIRAKELLGRAEVKILAAVPSVTSRIAAGTLNPQLVAGVELAMVERVLRNPDGHRQESSSIDDYSRSWTIDSALSAGALYISDQELADLQPSYLTDAAPFLGTARLGIGLQ